MPFITFEMIEGRTPEQKRKLMEEITALCVNVLDVPADRVHIFFEDLKKDQYARGGKFVSDIEAK